MIANEKYQGKYRTKSAHLPFYDYSQNGYYFVTICTKNRIEYFGSVVNDQMVLSEIGQVILDHWQAFPENYSSVSLDEFIIMPNHLHGILILREQDNHAKRRDYKETGQCPVSTNNFSINKLTRRPTLFSIIGAFKSICGRIIKEKQTDINFGWQPRFYDHVIRNQESLAKIREYIRQNPQKWELDKNNVENLYI